MLNNSGVVIWLLWNTSGCWLQKRKPTSIWWAMKRVPRTWRNRGMVGAERRLEDGGLIFILCYWSKQHRCSSENGVGRGPGRERQSTAALLKERVGSWKSVVKNWVGNKNRLVKWRLVCCTALLMNNSRQPPTLISSSTVEWLSWCDGLRASFNYSTEFTECEGASKASSRNLYSSPQTCLWLVKRSPAMTGDGDMKT